MTSTPSSDQSETHAAVVPRPRLKQFLLQLWMHRRPLTECVSLLLAFCLFIQGTQAGEALERWSRDVRFRLRPVPEASPPITLVLLRAQRVSQQVPSLRQALANTLERLAESNQGATPAGIIVDMLLNTEESSDPANHPLLDRIVASTRKLPGIVHGWRPSLEDSAFSDQELPLSALRGSSIPLQVSHWPVMAARAGSAVPSSVANDLYAKGAGFGNLAPLNDSTWIPRDRAVHQLPLLIGLAAQNDEERAYPAYALRMAALDLCPDRPLEDCLQLIPSGLRLAGKLDIPLDTSDGLYWINYRRRFQFSRTGQLSSGLEIVQAEELDPARLVGRYLILADAREAAVASTPFGTQAPLASIHAQVLANFLEQDFLDRRPAHHPVAIAMVLAVACLLLHLYQQFRKPRAFSRGWAVHWFEPLLMLVWSGLCIVTFTWNLELPWVLPILSGVSLKPIWRSRRNAWLDRTEKQALGMTSPWTTAAELPLQKLLERDLGSLREQLDGLPALMAAECRKHRRVREAEHALQQERQREALLAEADVERIRHENLYRRALESVAKDRNQALDRLEKDYEPLQRALKSRLESRLRDTRQRSDAGTHQDLTSRSTLEEELFLLEGTWNRDKLLISERAARREDELAKSHDCERQEQESKLTAELKLLEATGPVFQQKLEQELLEIQSQFETARSGLQAKAEQLETILIQFAKTSGQRPWL